MAPRLDFSDWFSKDQRKGTPVVVTMENPNYSLVQIEGPDAEFNQVDKGRGKNAKQFTWVLLLRAHRAAGCVAWLASFMWALLGTVNKRLILRQGVAVEYEKSRKGPILFKFIKYFLALCLVVLAFEVVAHFNGWHFEQPGLYIPQTSEIQSWFQMLYLSWLAFRADYIAPLIQALSQFCVILFLIQSLDRLVLCLGCFWIKFRKIKPTFRGDPFKSEDVEGCSSDFPKVIVQIPMCNEREVTHPIGYLNSFLPAKCLS